MPYLRQRSLTGIPASASFKIATIWLSVMRLLIVKLLCFSLKEILRVNCIILRGSYNTFTNQEVTPPHFPHLSPHWRSTGGWSCYTRGIFETSANTANTQREQQCV